MRIVYLNGAMWFVRQYPEDSLQAVDGRRATVAVGQGTRVTEDGTGTMAIRQWGRR